jgi:hypothetical protein
MYIVRDNAMTLGEPDIIEIEKIFLAVLNVTDFQETMQRVEESFFIMYFSLPKSIPPHPLGGIRVQS